MRTYISTCLLVLIATFNFTCQQESTTLFQEVNAKSVGIQFENTLKDSPAFNVMKYGYFYNGGGIGLADFNNDGFQDVYFTGNMVADQLYLNKGTGTIEFDNITKTAGINEKKGWKTGVSVVDINQDGWMDIYVCRSAAKNPKLRRNLLYINQKDGTFKEDAARFGLDDPGFSTQAVFFDYDRDGDLDCFILNHSIQKYAGFSQNLANLKKQKDDNYGSKLLENNNGTFSDISDKAGIISNVLSFGLGVMVSDFNNDNWLDLYISNDYNEEDYLYINQKNGTYKESIRASTNYTSLFSMGSDAADINNDGRLDIITLDMLPEGNDRIKMTSGDDNYQKFEKMISFGFHRQFMRNMLQVNVGNKEVDGVSTPIFQEMGQLAGISNTDWSWAALFADFDLDGNKDLFVTNGYEKDYTNMDFLNYTVDLQLKTKGQDIDEIEVISNMPSIHSPNYIFKGNGDATFNDQSDNWLPNKNRVSSGAVYGDLDNDGDLDLISNNINQAPTILKNNSTITKKPIIVDLKASPDKVIGSKVFVHSADNIQLQEFMPVRGFQSSMHQALHFAAPNTVDSIIVVWADGQKQILETVLDGANTISYAPSMAAPKDPMVNSTLEKLPFATSRKTPNDFNQQALLPYKVSQFGPCITSSKHLTFFAGNADTTGFILNTKTDQVITLPNTENTSVFDAIWFDYDGDGTDDLLTTKYSYQNSNQNGVYWYRGDQNGVSEKASLIKQGDFGALTAIGESKNSHFFVGAMPTSMQFPRAASSIIFSKTKDSYTETELDLGIVQAADSPEGTSIILARPFQSMLQVVLKNEEWVEQDIASTGLWQAAKTLSDHKKENLIFAGNWGQNNQLNFITDSTLVLYEVLAEDGRTPVPILGFMEEGKTYPFAARDEFLSHWPSLKKQYQSYDAFAKATLTDLFGDKLTQAKKQVVNTLQSKILVQDGSNWQEVELPRMVQSTCLNAVEVISYNDSDNFQLLLGGNSTHNRVRIGDLAAPGILKLTRKDGIFEPITYIPHAGEIRSMQRIGSTIYIADLDGAFYQLKVAQ